MIWLLIPGFHRRRWLNDRLEHFSGPKRASLCFFGLSMKNQSPATAVVASCRWSACENMNFSRCFRSQWFSSYFFFFFLLFERKGGCEKQMIYKGYVAPSFFWAALWIVWFASPRRDELVILWWIRINSRAALGFRMDRGFSWSIFIFLLPYFLNVLKVSMTRRGVPPEHMDGESVLLVCS